MAPAETVVRAIEVVLSNLKLDPETTRILKAQLTFARERAEAQRRADYREEQAFFDQG